MATWRPPKSAPRHSPLQGPPVKAECFEGLRVAGQMLTAHDLLGRSRSGVPELGIAARFHTALSDGISPRSTSWILTNSIAAELAMRYLLLVGMASRRGRGAGETGRRSTAEVDRCEKYRRRSKRGPRALRAGRCSSALGVQSEVADLSAGHRRALRCGCLQMWGLVKKTHPRQAPCQNGGLT